MIDRVELSVPSQAEMAAYVTAKFIGVENATESDDGANGTASDASSSQSSTFHLRDFPRTDTEQEDYERQIGLYNLNVKLLNTDAVKLSSKPKYLARRLVSLTVLT